jgi:quinohemoprotein ethanol dehydrogenase
MNPHCCVAALALNVLLVACTPSEPKVDSPVATGNVTAARLSAADSQPENWYTAGRDAGRTHHSPLKSIHEGNVGQLGLAWNYATGTTRGMEATPIVVDGVMYTSGVAGRVYVLNAATGEELWKFEPKIDMQVNRWTCCDAVNHGVVVWQGKVYVAALDGVLYSLEATTGKVLWSVDTIADHKRGYSSVGAPEVAGNVVVIGNAGGEYDSSGYVSAYGIDDGKLRWRSYLVPTGDPAKDASPDIKAAAKSWDPNSRWDIGGGGNAWDAILYDPEFNLVYVGTGNGEPHSAYVRSPSGGDNLYLSSIVAFHADTGRIAWHVQHAPGDSWDFDATQPMMLAEMKIGGQPRKVLLQAPKTGFFYVIERPSGKVLSASPYVAVTWATGVDLATGRVQINQNIANYSKQPALIFPSGQGGHNWNRMSFNPKTGIAFVPTIEVGEFFLPPLGTWEHLPMARNLATRSFFSAALDAMLPTLPKDVQKQLLALKNRPGEPDTRARAALRAIEPLSGKTLWEVAAAGGAWDHAGVLSTDGNLVFQGTGTGHMRVFRATDGKRLKEIDVGTSIIAAPMTYAVNGEQYVAVLAGLGGARWYYYEQTSAAHRYGNANRIISFKLGGTAEAKPVTELPPAGAIPEPPAQSDAATIEHGGRLFVQFCTSCHGDVDPTGSADLRRMSRAVHASFGDIVLRGQRLPLGMPRFDDLLTPADADAIHAYLIDHAWEAYRAEQTNLATPAAATGSTH